MLTELSVPHTAESLRTHAELLLRHRGRSVHKIHYVYSAGDPEAGWFCGRPCDTVLYVDGNHDAQTAFVWTETDLNSQDQEVTRTLIETRAGWVGHE